MINYHKALSQNFSLQLWLSLHASPTEWKLRWPTPIRSGDYQFMVDANKIHATSKLRQNAGTVL